MRISTTTDPKVGRIEAGWFRPAAADARWLATIADEIHAAPICSGTDGNFVYIPLSSRDCADAGSTLVVERNSFDEVARRIPALASLHAVTVALAA